MEIKPQDIKIEAETIYGNWGVRNGVSVHLTHIPTGICATAMGKMSMHRAKQVAYDDLVKLVDKHTDYYKQLELFND